MKEVSGVPATFGPGALPVSRLFLEVPEQVRLLLLNSVQPIQLEAGALLFQQGDAGDVMFVVQRGRIEISILSEAGRKIVLNQISAGHCLGEVSMIDGKPRTASAIAIEHSMVMPVGRRLFMQAARECSQLALNLADILCERLRWTSSSVEEYALLAIEVRVARRLISLLANFGDGRGSITITQNDLADYAGATRESTNKILIQWKADGVVSLARGKIVVNDILALEAVAMI